MPIAALHEFVSLAVAGLLACATIRDVRTRQLPNRFTGGIVLLYPLYVLASPVPVAWLGAVAVAAALFMAGAVLFAWRLLGGGDVKLIAALGLWSGPEHLGLFLAVTVLSGGALALAYLWYDRRGWFLIGLLCTVPRPSRTAAKAALAAPLRPAAALPQGGATAPTKPVRIPYGVAVAVGGFAVTYQILGL